MEALQAALAKKRKAAEELKGGTKKFLKRSEIEAARLAKLREEEEQERQAKELKRQQASAARPVSPLPVKDTQEDHQQHEVLSREEVVRRLRLLSQPVTLFGEDDAGRRARLQRAQEEYQLDDEHVAPQKANELLELIRQGKRDRGVAAQAAVGVQAPKPAGISEAEANGGDVDAHPIIADFERAAAELKDRLEEQSMCVEDRIHKYMKRWCQCWGDDLEGRPQEMKDSGPGTQATLQYQQTMAFFKPLFRQLKQRNLVPEMVAGLWMIVQDIQERNYLHGYDIYMRLAVGNAPWPIGVTSVGIHERSAREKISHSMNAAHIMNDEATRKYLQGIKRLLTFMQRAFPTDPSRSVDFDGFRDAGRGAAGSGSDKRALLEAERKGESWKQLGLLPAPHFVEADGSIKVPAKWENMVKKSEVFQEKGLAAARTPPRTPPRAPPA